jgi:hypothetical protein
VSIHPSPRTLSHVLVGSMTDASTDTCPLPPPCLNLSLSLSVHAGGAVRAVLPPAPAREPQRRRRRTQVSNKSHAKLTLTCLLTNGKAIHPPILPHRGFYRLYEMTRAICREAEASLRALPIRQILMSPLQVPPPSPHASSCTSPMHRAVCIAPHRMPHA